MKSVERPRERVAREGVESLDDMELLASSSAQDGQVTKPKTWPRK